MGSLCPGQGKVKDKKNQPTYDPFTEQRIRKATHFSGNLYFQKEVA
jgi:hypothetical protein